MRRSLGAAGRDDTGFTVVELLIVVAVISVLAAVALPVLSRARAAALEGQTIGVLRAIHGGQAAYAASCASGFYAPSMRWLSRPPADGGVGFISPGLDRNRIDRGNYRIRFFRGQRGQAPQGCNGLQPNRAVRNYFVSAYPIIRDGSRYFGTNQEGTIYQSSRWVRITYQGSPPPPAVPLR